MSTSRQYEGMSDPCTSSQANTSASQANTSTSQANTSGDRSSNRSASVMTSISVADTFTTLAHTNRSASVASSGSLVNTSASSADSEGRKGEEKAEEVGRIYTKLLEQVEGGDNQEVLARPKCEFLLGHMQEADELFEHVRRPQELVKDAHVVRAVAGLVARRVAATDTNLRRWVRSCTNTLTTLARFQQEEFCRRLVTQFAPNPEVDFFPPPSQCGLFLACLGPFQALIRG